MKVPSKITKLFALELNQGFCAIEFQNELCQAPMLTFSKEAVQLVPIAACER
jgi:hypothetical protein